MQYMSEDDLTAIARYLKSLPAVDPKDQPHQYDKQVAEALWKGDDSQPGAAVYIDNCAACHRTDGHGYTRVFPALAGNPVLQTADELKRILEPRAAAPKARLRAIRVMREAGIPVGVLCSPMIPMINDSELESLLAEAHAAGAQSAAYMMLRLPLEVAPLFEEWLAAHYPQRAAHVMSLVRQVRGGEVYDSRFGVRMRGEGPFADLLAQRFAKAIKRLGLDQREGFNLDCSAFCPPGRQLALL